MRHQLCLQRVSRALTERVATLSTTAVQQQLIGRGVYVIVLPGLICGYEFSTLTCRASSAEQQLSSLGL